MSFRQWPIRSEFGPATSAAEVIGTQDLSGRIAIVTGGYSGIGLETVRVLAEAGARVVVAARRTDRARQALEGIERVETDFLDLSDPESIDSFAGRFLARGAPLSILINSAGIMATPFARDARGNELQLSTNHLGHFQLTLRLAGTAPRRPRSSGARPAAASKDWAVSTVRIARSRTLSCRVQTLRAASDRGPSIPISQTCCGRSVWIRSMARRLDPRNSGLRAAWRVLCAMPTGFHRPPCGTLA